MSFNRLLLLHSTLLESVATTTVGTKLPIRPLKQQAPITAIKSWKEVDGFLCKEFVFETFSTRNRFINNILSYEEEKGHNARIFINDLKVFVKVTTKTLNKITELDKEYSKALDLLEKELCHL